MELFNLVQETSEWLTKSVSLIAELKSFNVGYFVISPQVPEALVTFSQSLFYYSYWVNSVVLSSCSLIHHLYSTVSPSSKS